MDRHKKGQMRQTNIRAEGQGDGQTEEMTDKTDKQIEERRDKRINRQKKGQMRQTNKQKGGRTS